jgi:hypothetical protein
VKITIPEQLKAEVPPNLWGKVLNITPIVMTVIATMLAGLSSSEMTRAQYTRSMATQQQSKAGDQWGFFQAKRLRGALQTETLDLLKNTLEVPALDSATLAAALGPRADQPTTRAAIELLVAGQLPAAAPAPATDAKVLAALEAVDHAVADAELVRVLSAVGDPAVTAELRAAQDRARAFDTLTKPVNQAIDEISAALDASPSEHAPLNRAFTAARLRFATRRYEAEARLNQAIANLYELQVRKSNLAAERHILRSQRFFYGMLAAQTGVIAATFAIAARKRNFLWSLAAAAGVGAVSFAAYVFIFL